MHKLQPLTTVAALCVAALFSTGASAAVVTYTFSGGGGLSPTPGSGAGSGWLTENRTSFAGLSPTSALDNGVITLVPASYLNAIGPWDATYSGTATITDGVLTGGTLSWTGNIGMEATGSPGFVGVGFYGITLVNGSYDLLTGAYTGGQNCAANAGPAAMACLSEQAGFANMTLGTTSFTDLGGGLVQLVMASNAFTANGGVKTIFQQQGPPIPGSPGYNSVVTWQLNVIPIPAAVWLLGPALAGLGLLRRRPSVA